MKLIEYLDKVTKEEFLSAVGELNLEIKIPDREELSKYLILVDRTYNYIKLLAKSEETVETNKQIIVTYFNLPPYSALYILMSEYGLSELLDDYLTSPEGKDKLMDYSVNMMNNTPLSEWLFCEVENSAINEDGEVYGTITDAGILAVTVMEMAHSVNGAGIYG